MSSKHDEAIWDVEMSVSAITCRLGTLQKQNFHFERAFVKAKIHFSN